MTWILVTGDVGERGGQDKANHALATALLARGDTVHLVAHAVSDDLAQHPSARVHLVPRPLRSHLAGAPLLDRAGRRVASAIRARDPAARVVVNGGNCAVADVNWVHAVHAAWPRFDAGAPLGARVKNRVAKWLAARSERRIVPAARLVLANSERTRRDLARIGVPAHRIRVIPLGTDPHLFGPVSEEERNAARLGLGVPPATSVLLFVGALGYEAHKGLDCLLAALRRVGPPPASFLVLAAGGGALDHWRAAADALGVGGQVSFLGPVEDVPRLLAAADLLVSPTRYEAYGLAVQEALCRGVPAVVTGTAGVAERYGPDLADLLLGDPDDADELAATILRWRSRREEFAAAARRHGERLRAYTWRDMAAEVIRVVEESVPATERRSA
jgi:glycosyltransferase involved in cell wall biosynthesis